MYLHPPANLSALELVQWVNEQVAETNRKKNAMTGLEWKKWVDDQIRVHDEQVMASKLEQAKGGRAVFLPFLGEVGWVVMHQMRLVHFNQAAYKIVCCKPGQECLFPSANQFHTDWIDPVDDGIRAGTFRQQVEWPAITSRFPDATPIHTGGLSSTQELFPYSLNEHIPISPRTIRGLQADICIGVRSRAFIPQKNYPHWPAIATALKARGLTYAVIGSSASSYPLEGMVCMSGDYGDYDAAIELLQSCKLYIGTDSGGSHLASVANGCPMVVLNVPESTRTVTQNGGMVVRHFIDRMASTTTHPVIQLPATEWDNPEAILEQIDKLIPRVQAHKPTKKKGKK